MAKASEGKLAEAGCGRTLIFGYDKALVALCRPSGPQDKSRRLSSVPNLMVGAISWPPSGPVFRYHPYFVITNDGQYTFSRCL